jgi:hypothetical protein
MTPQVEFLVRALELLSEQLCSEGRTVGSSLINDAITVLKREPAAPVSAPAATPAPTPSEVEMKYRTELWVNHGHDGIYGDDGEMQCSRCRPWDYKRAPLAEVEAAAEKARMERIARSFPPAATVAGTRPEKEE